MCLRASVKFKLQPRRLQQEETYQTLPCFLTWQLSTSKPFKIVKIDVKPSRNAHKYFKISVAKEVFDGHLDVACVADGQPVE
jgi:hypothetical protein